MLTNLFREEKTNRKISQLEKDRRLVLSAMKRKMQHSKKTGTPIDRPGEQLLEYPLALCDSEGNLIKGQKSYSTRSFESRYKDAYPQVITTEIPSRWRPNTTIMEAPLRNTQGFFRLCEVPDPKVHNDPVF